MCKHGTKTTPVILPADREASWLLLPSPVSLLSGSTVQPENIYSPILKVTGQIWEGQKRISINTNHSYHQRFKKKYYFILKIIRFLCVCKINWFQNLRRHHKHCYIMVVTLTLILLNAKSYGKETWSNTSVLYDKYFWHLFGSMLETGN